MRTQFVAMALLCCASVAFAQQLPNTAAANAGQGVGVLMPQSAAPTPPLIAAPPSGPPIASYSDSPLLPPVIEGGPVVGAGSVSRGGPAEGMFWLSGGYLLGWIPQMSMPMPLVTTGSPSDISPGALRQPGTQILYGTKIDFDTFQGFQVEAGLFCDEEQTWSFDAKGFALFTETTSFGFASDGNGNPPVMRPVYNVLVQTEGAFIDALPNFAKGGVNITAESEMWGFETNTRCHIGSGRLRGDLLAGFRYVRLSESLRIQDQLAPLRNNVLTYLGEFVNAPNSLTDYDHFATRNEFFGGQIGGTVIWEDAWYFLRFSGKVGFGCTQQTATIDGASTLVSPTGNSTTPGGILAQSSNMGSRTRNVFGILPEWGVTGGFYITKNIRLSAGYSLLMWNRVVRPGDAIDRGVNPGLVPTAASYGRFSEPARPEFRWNDSSFWLQSATAGLEFYF